MVHSPRRHFKTKPFKFWESRNGDKRLGVISLLSLQSQHGERTPLVSDVIIAGWGVEVSLSRLKWKIAPHNFGKGVCCVTCLQKPPSLFIHVVQGLEGQLALGLLFPAQNPLGSFLHQFECAAVLVVPNMVCLFYPTAQHLSTEVKDVDLIDSGSVDGASLVSYLLLWFLPVRKQFN